MHIIKTEYRDIDFKDIEKDIELESPLIKIILKDGCII